MRTRTQKQVRVARQLIAFGRLKLVLVPLIVKVPVSRKTTNRLRAIETATQGGRRAGRPVVARQLIAFGRLKHEDALTAHPFPVGRKTTNRLRAIETRFA